MYTHTPHGYLVADTYLLTDTFQDKYINLAMQKGAPMRYDQSLEKVIDFPGEYDIDGNSIVCYEAGGHLHYQIMHDNDIIVLVQDPALLEKATLSNVTVWLCTSEKTKEAIERDELEGKVIIMTTEPVAEETTTPEAENSPE